MIEADRIKFLNNKRETRGDFIVYWMQASQRTIYNHALEYAIKIANELSLPVIVYFGITGSFPEANLRHYRFMVEGLKDVENRLRNRGIRFLVMHESPDMGVVHLSERASIVVVDRGYLKIQRQWRNYVASHIECPLVQVETDAVIPVESASNKEEYSAATLRRKISNKMDKYLVQCSEYAPKMDSFSINIDSNPLDVSDGISILSKLNIDRSVSPVDKYHGGTDQAENLLEHFLNNNIDPYPDLKNNPAVDITSGLSPYLHFGQISPLYIALKTLSRASKGSDSFLEELIVRRELSMNFVNYNQHYEEFECLSSWSKKSLFAHESDHRERIYSTEELEKAETHDRYWNAAQQEMVSTGKMHGYMRMYWGKKIIEWNENPVEAYRIARYLNNKYELDGRDPNSYAGIAWCFGKHDRPWPERKIYGNIRYMSSSGLERKFDIDRYVARINSIIQK